MKKKYSTDEERKTAQKIAQRKYLQKPEVKAKRKKYMKEYLPKYYKTEKGKTAHRKSASNYYLNLKKDPTKFANYKLAHNLRHRVREVLKIQFKKKNKKDNIYTKYEFQNPYLYDNTIAYKKNIAAKIIRKILIFININNTRRFNNLIT